MENDIVTMINLQLFILMEQRSGGLTDNILNQSMCKNLIEHAVIYEKMVNNNNTLINIIYKILILYFYFVTCKINYIKLKLNLSLT